MGVRRERNAGTFLSSLNTGATMDSFMAAPQGFGSSSAITDVPNGNGMRPSMAQSTASRRPLNPCAEDSTGYGFLPHFENHSARDEGETEIADSPDAGSGARGRAPASASCSAGSVREARRDVRTGIVAPDADDQASASLEQSAQVASRRRVIPDVLEDVVHDDDVGGLVPRLELEQSAVPHLATRGWLGSDSRGRTRRAPARTRSPSSPRDGDVIDSPAPTPDVVEHHSGRGMAAQPAAVISYFVTLYLSSPQRVGGSGIRGLR